MQRRLLFTLLVAIVAGLAERLEVALIPEQPLITTMSLAMVTHQQGRVAFQLAASLAHIEIAKECAEPELLPSRGLVPGAPWRRGSAAVLGVRSHYPPKGDRSPAK